MEPYLIAAICSLVLVAVFAIVQLLNLRKLSKHYEKKFAPILNIEKEVASITKRKEKLETAIRELRTNYKEKKAIFDRLVREAAIYDEEIELAELGFYKPHFDFDTSEKYKEQIATVRNELKQMVSDKNAIFCTTEWAVEGSKAKGRTMTNRGIRLTARAFNNECDAAISNVSWNNAKRMEQEFRRHSKQSTSLTNRMRSKFLPRILV